MRALPRGRFGASIRDGLLSVHIDIPARAQLYISRDKLLKAIGNSVASNIRKRLSAGIDGDGSPLPTPQTGNTPFNRTGELIKSIKYYSKSGMVSPGMWTRQGIGRRARSNFGLMSILIANVFTRKGKPQNPSRPEPKDPMGSLSPKTVEIIEKAAAREVARQLKKGEMGLILDLRRKWQAGRASRR